MSRERRRPASPPTSERPDMPAALLPVVMAVTFLQGRAEKARRTEDLGALSFELVLLAIGLIVVATTVIGVLVAAITNKASSLK
ncbi:hypothetical protein [Streptacidiphilus sp. MAP5-3]|uniref:hypothetical protein n=1 Tax=unclassified Streptacidiphilus TaxID=2643834 RepID=UPI0035140565